MGCLMSDEFVRVADTGQLPSGSMMLVEPDGSERILLVNLDGTYHAISELCPHYGVPLSQGRLYEDEVECPLHGSCFRVQTGAVLNPPCWEDLFVYQVRIEGSDIFVGPQVQ